MNDIIYIKFEEHEIKQMIIENYICWYASSQEEIDNMIKGAQRYINEIKEN